MGCSLSVVDRIGFLDAVVCICLAASIHQSDKGVRECAKRASARLVRSDRYLMMHIAAHKRPLEYVLGYLQHIPADILGMPPK